MPTGQTRTEPLLFIKLQYQDKSIAKLYQHHDSDII